MSRMLPLWVIPERGSEFMLRTRAAGFRLVELVFPAQFGRVISVSSMRLSVMPVLATWDSLTPRYMRLERPIFFWATTHPAGYMTSRRDQMGTLRCMGHRVTPTVQVIVIRPATDQYGAPA